MGHFGSFCPAWGRAKWAKIRSCWLILEGSWPGQVGLRSREQVRHFVALERGQGLESLGALEGAGVRTYSSWWRGTGSLLTRVGNKRANGSHLDSFRARTAKKDKLGRFWGKNGLTFWFNFRSWPNLKIWKSRKARKMGKNGQGKR